MWFSRWCTPWLACYMHLLIFHMKSLQQLTPKRALKSVWNQDATKRDAPNVYKQYTQKTNLSNRKERKSLKKSNASHNKEPKKNSGEREFHNPKNFGATPQGIRKRDPTTFGLTNLHHRMSFSYALPKYKKINKSEPTTKLLFSSSLVPWISIWGEGFSFKLGIPKQD